MSRYLEWIEHKGKRILYVDFSGLKPHEILQAMDENQEEILRQPADSTILTLTNMSGTRTTTEMNEKGKEIAAATQGRVKAAAVIGLSGIQKVIAMGVRSIHTEDSMEDAKDWLVSQANG